MPKIHDDSPEKGWVVYLIQTTSGKIYTGITNDLKRRFNAHLTQNKGARFFRISGPEKIIRVEHFPDRSGASKRESVIKKMSRAEKLELIASADGKLPESNENHFTDVIQPRCLSRKKQ